LTQVLRIRIQPVRKLVSIYIWPSLLKE
jgi:hypothetical protein